MEHKITKPNKPLHSTIFKNETGWELYTTGDDLFISGDCTKAEAEAALAAHNPPTPTEPTVADKLASVGLSLEELRTALGSN
jgi:hypothetical protein